MLRIAPLTLLLACSTTPRHRTRRRRGTLRRTTSANDASTRDRSRGGERVHVAVGATDACRRSHRVASSLRGRLHHGRPHRQLPRGSLQVDRISRRRRLNSCGVLDNVIHTENGVHMVSAPEPVIPGGNPGVPYGRYVVRFRSDAIAGYKTAWLLWPNSDNWPTDGEIDFPEGNLDTRSARSCTARAAPPAHPKTRTRAKSHTPRGTPPISSGAPPRARSRSTASSSAPRRPSSRAPRCTTSCRPRPN